MTLPFIIGEDSANEVVFVDFEQLPHLFVSYNDEAQIREFIGSLISSLQLNNNGLLVDYALAVSARNHHLTLRRDCNIKYCFVSDDYLMSNVGSKLKFMQALLKEMRSRSIYFRKLAEGKPEKKKQVPHLIILLHDVFDIVLSSKKSIGQIFLQLLLLGKALKMHVVAASGNSYRMLLKQLANLDPSVMRKFRNQFGHDHLNIVTPLGAELVITAEDFIFFKKANAIDYQRLYPARKSLHESLSYIPRVTTTLPMVAPC
ncbi:hypothetical protein OCK74_20390 [Chitinophagaceae bacterium LB-8]|uniref:FtsK domain-containing protein n=1 Tax=Paraflavisolibacter caeni TaxID=2982496 RepID=A0A9X2XZD2_9BACT|nr:hypothetical protein [Paraflavisolibacter caeni]MCU7551492.1 hypothetical protein [Paraflavisolibacter caeni]